MPFMDAWGLAAVACGLLLVGASARLAAWIRQPGCTGFERHPAAGALAARYAPLVLRGTIVLAGAYLVVVGFSAF